MFEIFLKSLDTHHYSTFEDMVENHVDVSLYWLYFNLQLSTHPQCFVLDFTLPGCSRPLLIVPRGVLHPFKSFHVQVLHQRVFTNEWSQFLFKQTNMGCWKRTDKFTKERGYHQVDSCLGTQLVGSKWLHNSGFSRNIRASQKDFHCLLLVLLISFTKVRKENARCPIEQPLDLTGPGSIC